LRKPASIFYRTSLLGQPSLARHLIHYPRGATPKPTRHDPTTAYWGQKKRKPAITRRIKAVNESTFLIGLEVFTLATI
jgi:hypothetical protein